LIVTGNAPISRVAQSRTCLWVSAAPRNGEGAGTVPGPNRSSRSYGHPKIEDILKQRRCGPFWCLPVVQRPGLL